MVLAALKGSVIVGDETMPHQSFHTLVLSGEASETGVKLTAAEDNTDFVLVSLLPSCGFMRGAHAGVT